ncbi:hypothetical protein SERLA73DRAFT_147940 [Serpula lacrymans var. lacrymans S7.3]|uniref:DUF6533 domain-containing protein n=2 Tax=Serpula lacrymans var. lacrymans TaxID=341189 RepID=F8QIC9_SERL3|nr:hypothetical protein SERLA73DRAFT_147940 [Serpula lacrymans var. lacrymans S7.3]
MAMLIFTRNSYSALISTLVALGTINRKVNANAVASLAWLLYDIIICFEDEIELVWRSRWTLPKVLYLSLRYYAPLWLMYQSIIHLSPGTALSNLRCTSFPALQSIGPLVLWVLVDFVLILRINALYGSNRKVQYLMAITWISAAAVIIPVSIYCFRLSRPVPAPAPFSMVAGCLVLNIDWNKMKVAKAAVIAFMILNVFYIGMTLFKFVQSIRSLRRVRLGSVLSIFVAEGLMYFFVCLGANAADIVFSSGSPTLFSYVDLAQFWLAAFYSYSGCHLILHLRANTRQKKATTFTDATEMQFQYHHRGQSIA